MSLIEEASYEEVLATVESWPPDQRLDLVRDVLKTLEPELKAAEPQRATLSQALGLLSRGEPPPSDADVEQWLNQRRMEKYG